MLPRQARNIKELRSRGTGISVTWLPRNFSGITAEIEIRRKCRIHFSIPRTKVLFATASIGSPPARVHSRSIISVKLGLLTGVRAARADDVILMCPSVVATSIPG